jgi:hypothetical protein
LTDTNGQYEFEIEDSWADVYLLAKDTDGADNGMYLPGSTDSFDVNDITPVIRDIAMTPDIVSAHESGNKKAQANSPKLSVLSGRDGILSMTLKGTRHESGTVAYIMDAKGRVIAALPVSPDGAAKWNTKTFSRGVYYLHAQIDGAGMIAPIIVK